MMTLWLSLSVVFAIGLGLVLGAEVYAHRWPPYLRARRTGCSELTGIVLMYFSGSVFLITAALWASGARL